VPPTGRAPLPATRIDFPVAVRGASSGFSVLVIGVLLSQLILFLAPSAPALVVYFAPYVLGSYVAARKVGNATIPALHGVAASVGAFLLTLPLLLPLLLLMMLDAQPLESIRYLATGLTLAIGIGAITGWMNSGRQRGR
jgi:hypothetical protein